MVLKRWALGTIALAWMCASAGAADPPRSNHHSKTPVSLKELDEGRLRLTRGSQKLVLNLARDISGCPGRVYDPSTNEEFEGGASFEVVDETEKGPYTYVVLLASAAPNCNIQGECGAGGSDTTLLWLKLSRDLKLAGKQAFGIDDCRAGRSARITRETDPEGEIPETYFEIKPKDLPWNGDVLKVDYEQDQGATVRRLIYDRRNPDAGFKQVPVEAPVPGGS
jgi:hypothetical protein